MRRTTSEDSQCNNRYRVRSSYAGSTSRSFGWKLGTPYRAIRSKEPWSPLQLIAGGARRTDAEKYARHFSVYGGQGVEKIREILGAGEIVARLLQR
jgi:hypothetical protein